MYVHGAVPEDEIDHRDRNPSNNAIRNLRECDRNKNMMNSTIRSDNRSGCKGVSWRSKSNKWVVQLSMGGEQKWLGEFTDLNEAIRFCKSKSKELYGEFYCDGN